MELSKLRMELTLTFLVFTSLLSFGVSDSQGVGLYVFRTSLNASANQLSDWNPNLVNPCTWSNVICDSNNNATSVTLSSMGFSAVITPEIGTITTLRSLSLQGNGITGTIPKQIGNLTDLTNLDLEDNHLSGEIPSSLELKPGEPVLDWPTRKRVALGTARGLEYLHEHCNPKIIHRDVKAANVLLDEDFEAVVGDFGLAKLVDVRQTNVTTQVRGTMGHIASEYLSTGKSSERTDVFGYGVMLLQLVTGQRAIDFSRLEEEDEVLLLDHVKKLEREKRLDAIVDRNLNNNYDILEVEMMIQVALLCTHVSPEDCPTMSDVVRMLEGEGLAERWEEWQHVEVTRRQEYERLQRRFDCGEDSIYNQDAIELSGGR